MIASPSINRHLAVTKKSEKWKLLHSLWHQRPLAKFTPS